MSVNWKFFLHMECIRCAYKKNKWHMASVSVPNSNTLGLNRVKISYICISIFKEDKT